MTRRAAPTATPTPIPATTENGSGLLIPITKAIGHIMAIHTALMREWPMTCAEAGAELHEAQSHLRNAVIPRELMTEDAITQIDLWINDLQDRITTMRALLNLDDPLRESTEVEPLRAFATNSWQLLTHLDRELTGLEPNNTDPGQVP